MKLTGRPRKEKRNNLIYKLRNKGKTFPEIAEMLGLKSKGTVADLYYREVRERAS